MIKHVALNVDKTMALLNSQQLTFTLDLDVNYGSLPEVWM